MSLTEDIRQHVFSLGFDLVGFTSAESFERGEDIDRFPSEELDYQCKGP